MVLKAQVSCSNISLAYEMCKTMEIELRYTLRKANEMEDSKQEMVRIKFYVGLMNDDVNFLLFVFSFFLSLFVLLDICLVPAKPFCILLFFRY